MRRRSLALLVDELHPAQKRRGELAQPGVTLGRLLEAGLPVASRPTRQVGLVLAQLLLRHDGQQSGAQLVVADNGNYQRVLFHSVRTASADRVREMAAPRRHLGLLCFLHQAWRDTLDQAVDMYGKLLDRNRKRVDERLDDMLKAQRHAVDRIVQRYRRLGAVLLDPDGDPAHVDVQQGAGLVPGRSHRTAQHRVGRRENVFVAGPAPRPRQQGRRAVEPRRFVFEEPRQPFAGGGVERAQTQVLTDALLMLGDRLLPALVGVDRLGVGPQLQGREPQDLPVDFQGRLLGEPPEHTHEGDLVREAQPIVGAPPQGDLSSVGLEHAQQIAGHASPRTTKLYDRTADTVTLEEIERIVI